MVEFGSVVLVPSADNQWHVQVRSTNGKVLMWSENYERRAWAEEVATAFAEKLGVPVGYKKPEEDNG